MDSILYELKGTNGIVTVYDDRVVISRNTFSGFMAQGGYTGDKTYFYSDLMNVEFKKASFVANGYIKFIPKGTNERQAVTTLFGTSKETFQDPNTVIFRAFRKDIPDKSEELYNIIQSKVENSKRTNNCSHLPGSSKMDELKKLGELRQSGVLTEEEFLIEKKKLLNS